MALDDQQLVTGAPHLLFTLFLFSVVYKYVSFSFFKVGESLCNCAHGKPTFITLLFGLALFCALFGSAAGVDPFVYSAGSERTWSYTRETLLSLRGPSLLHGDKPVVPVDIRRKRRGCRGGKKKRRTYFPTIIMGNLRSISNKTEELAALTKQQKEFRECSVMCFSETWLNGLTPDSVVSLDGFTLVRGDRSEAGSGKKKGGGVAVFVNERWCNPANVHVKQQMCTRNLELLVVAMRPFYLPREFSHVIVFCVYIPPSADAAEACERLHGVISRVQARHPRALLLISGDFNHASLSASLPTFIQYVQCHTRDNKTLDLLYANVKDAYTSVPLPPLGRSDHNLVYLIPKYTPKVRREPAQKRSVKVWTEDANERLRDCFQTTDWSMFCSSYGDDIDGLTHCITDYINFCVDSTVPVRRVRCFPNNHPWVTPELKVLLNQKKRAFNSGDKEEQRRVQRELQWRIRRAKKDYGRKLEEKLAQNNVRDVWRGLKNISGFGQSVRGTTDGDQRWADELNCFFNRFDSPPTPSAPLPTPPSSHVSSPVDTSPLPRPSSPAPCSSTWTVSSTNPPPPPTLSSPPQSHPHSTLSTTSPLTPSAPLPAPPPSSHVSSTADTSPLPHPPLSAPCSSTWTVPSPSPPLPPTLNNPPQPPPHSPLSITSPLIPPAPLPAPPSSHVSSPENTFPLPRPPSPAPCSPTWTFSSSSPPPPPTLSSPPQTPPHSPLSITSDQVRKELRRLKQRKSAGPDRISPRLLRTCADQLCEVLCHLFNLSLSLEKIPVLWKTSCVVPVPKTVHAKEPAHYRPVALTSHLMKTMERLLLRYLRSVVSSTLDPLQFAYRPNIGVEDAIIYLLQRALTHLETAGTAVRVMFFDFSSAFNTIRPALLRGKLEDAGVDGHLAAWIINYLTDRPQYVRLRGCESEVVVCSTGAPQGTVLSPFLFTIYTSDFTYNTDSCHLQKFSDDSAIVGCVSEGNELEYRSVIMDFVDWCERNHLCLNTSKTKEMVIDFRRRTLTHSPVNIQGEDIETVDSFKYLGVHLNNKLDWSHNTDALYKKGQSRLHLLRRLGSFGVCRTLLRTFYDSVVASAILYAVVCWAPGSTERDRNRLNKLVRRASSVLGCPLDSVEDVGERRMLAKFTSIMDNSSHPLHRTVEELSSSFSGRLRHPQCRKERYRRAFIPTAVRLYNATV